MSKLVSTFMYQSRQQYLWSFVIMYKDKWSALFLRSSQCVKITYNSYQVFCPFLVVFENFAKQTTIAKTITTNKTTNLFQSKALPMLPFFQIFFRRVSTIFIKTDVFVLFWRYYNIQQSFSPEIIDLSQNGKNHTTSNLL